MSYLPASLLEQPTEPWVGEGAQGSGPERVKQALVTTRGLVDLNTIKKQINNNLTNAKVLYPQKSERDYNVKEFDFAVKMRDLYSTQNGGFSDTTENETRMFTSLTCLFPEIMDKYAEYPESTPEERKFKKMCIEQEILARIDPVGFILIGCIIDKADSFLAETKAEVTVLHAGVFTLFNPEQVKCTQRLCMKLPDPEKIENGGLPNASGKSLTKARLQLAVVDTPKDLIDLVIWARKKFQKIYEVPDGNAKFVSHEKVPEPFESNIDRYVNPWALWFKYGEMFANCHMLKQLKKLTDLGLINISVGVNAVGTSRLTNTVVPGDTETALELVSKLFGLVPNGTAHSSTNRANQGHAIPPEIYEKFAYEFQLKSFCEMMHDGSNETDRFDFNVATGNLEAINENNIKDVLNQHLLDLYKFFTVSAESVLDFTHRFDVGYNTTTADAGHGTDLYHLP